MPTRPELSAKDWNRLNRLLEVALAIDEPGEREQWLQGLALEDADLAPFLRKALTETSQEPTTVSSPALTAPPEERAGDLIGPYRLVRELGKGGMGTVWLAERSDGSFQRKVALKLPRSEWVDRGLAQRFARERAVLATLDHPHIAQMLDAGQTPSGRPYLALEYVEGVPIDAWCEEQKLGVVAKLRLFVEVIRAVSHAHARLVVHRDLKPSNVLVTADGRSKLLDFGIAKLLTAETGAAEETELTRLAGRALTPSYAAPEQILGQPVSTATDIYALGVMLYELLTGARPYGFGRNEPISRAVLEDRIVTADVRPPSDAAADPSTKRVLRGDLDAIVLKTLKKKPAQRYETAAAFADDIDRYLNHLPVRAQRDSRAYRWRRFIVRNRLVVGATAAVVAALAVGLSIALWQARAAREEAAHSNTIKDFVLSIIQQADPVASQQTRAADILLLTAAEQRVARELNGRPELQLQVRLAIAIAYRNRGDFEGARKVLRMAFDEAAQSLPSDHIDLLHARVLLAEWPLIDGAGALKELDAAIAALRRLGKPAVPALIDGLIARLFILNSWWQAPPQSAFSDAHEAIALAKQTFEPNHPKIIEANSELAELLLDDARPEEALVLIERIYRLASENPVLGSGHPMRLKVRSLFGSALCAVGRYDEGMAQLREAVELARIHHGSQSRMVRIALAGMSWALYTVGDLKRAIEALREAHAIAVLLEPLGSINRSKFAFVLAHRLNTARRPQEAPSLLEESASANEAFPAGALREAWKWWGMWQLAFTYTNLGETTRAQQIDEYLLQDAETEKSTERLASVLWDLSRATRIGGNPATAESIAERLVNRVRSDSLGWVKPLAIGELGIVKLEVGKFQEALALLDEATKLQRRPGWFPTDAAVHLAMGRALLGLQRTSEAQTALEKVDAFWREFDADHPLAAEAAWWFGQALVATGETARGKTLLAEARPRLAASWLPHLRPLATAPPPIASSAPTTVARE